MTGLCCPGLRHGSAAVSWSRRPGWCWDACRGNHSWTASAHPGEPWGIHPAEEDYLIGLLEHRCLEEECRNTSESSSSLEILWDENKGAEHGLNNEMGKECNQSLCILYKILGVYCIICFGLWAKSGPLLIEDVTTAVQPHKKQTQFWIELLYQRT